MSTILAIKFIQIRHSMPHFRGEEQVNDPPRVPPLGPTAFIPNLGLVSPQQTQRYWASTGIVLVSTGSKGPVLPILSHFYAITASMYWFSAGNEPFAITNMSVQAKYWQSGYISSQPHHQMSSLHVLRDLGSRCIIST